MATNSMSSSYLNSKEGTIVGRFGEPSQKLSPFLSNNRKGEKKEESEEIGVFGAEKYFNEGEVVLVTPRTPSIASRKYLYQRDEQIALETTRKFHYGTPSIRSESTTSNSQSALLQSGIWNASRNRKEKVQPKSVLAGLGFKCSCSDKNSVDISDEINNFNKTARTYGVSRGKSTPRKVFDLGLEANNNNSLKINMPNAELLLNKDVYFQKQGLMKRERKNSLTLSNMSPGLGNHLVKMQLQLEEEEEAPPRKSLEVFGSPILSNKSNKSFDKRSTLKTPSREAIPKMEEIGSNYNDAASDASSDLFEIESIKGNSNSNPFLARQASDAASSCVSPTTCYAPSEASIDWSVVTASAAVMSDCEEQMSEVTIRSPIRTPFNFSNEKTLTKANREVQKKRSSILLGCKSNKAVRVAGDAFITYEKPSSSPRIQNRINTSQVARFPSETKMGNGGARHGQQQLAYSTPPLQRSHSPRASKLIYA